MLGHLGATVLIHRSILNVSDNRYMAVESKDFFIGDYADLISPPMLLPALGDAIQVHQH